MPLLHCTKCHHEWEGQSLDKCDWCGADSYILAEQTDLEIFLSDKGKMQRLINRFKSAIFFYELSVFIYDTPAAFYPVDIKTLHLGRFPTLKKAENAMLAFIIGGPNKRYELIHSFVVRESGVVLPLPGSHYEIRVYDEQGDLYGMRECDWQPYTGKELTSNRFKLKDFVEFIIGDHLHVGIIAGLPLSIDKVSKIKSRIRSVCDQSDNTYAVLYGLEYHDHLSECQLFKPRFNIAEETRQKLLDRLGDKSSLPE